MSPKELRTDNSYYLLPFPGILTFLIRDLFFTEKAEVAMAERQAQGPDTCFLGVFPKSLQLYTSGPNWGYLCFQANIHFWIIWFWEKAVTKQCFQTQACNVHAHWETRVTRLSTSQVHRPSGADLNLTHQICPACLSIYYRKFCKCTKQGEGCGDDNLYLPFGVPSILYSGLPRAPLVLGFAQSLSCVLWTSSPDSGNLSSWWFHVHTNSSYPSLLPSTWNRLCFDGGAIFPTPCFSFIQ